jgi:hypothetical protein
MNLAAGVRGVVEPAQEAVAHPIEFHAGEAFDRTGLGLSM